MSRVVRRFSLALLPALLLPLLGMPSASAVATAAPGTPTGLASYDATDGVRVTYAPAPSDASNAATSFEVFRGTTADDLVPIGTTTSVRGFGDAFSADLTPGSTHTYAVRAVNSVGASPLTSPITVVAPSQARVPTARRLVVVDSARGSDMGSRLGDGTVLGDPATTAPGLASDESGLHLAFAGPSEGLTLHLLPPSGTRLVAGTYSWTYPATGSQASLTFGDSLNASGICHDNAGSIVINDIAYDVNGVVKVLDADATYTCRTQQDTTAIRIGVDTAYSYANVPNVTAPDTAVGTTRQAAATYTNSGATPITISDVKVTTGQAATGWALAGTNSCLTTLNPGQSCQVGLAATPAAEGYDLALVTFTDSTPLTTHVRSLLVRGVTAPATVSFLTATRNAGAVTLHWQRNNDYPNRMATGYRILRGPNAAQMTTLATIAATATPQYTDADTADGTRSYAVVAVNDAGESAPTAPLNLDLASRAASPFQSGNTPKSTVLQWSAPTGLPPNPITGYAVFRGTTSTSLTQVATTTAMTWVGPAPAPGAHHWYAVEPITSGGNGPRSSLSEVVGTTMQLIADRTVDGLERVGVLTYQGMEGWEAARLAEGGQGFDDVAVSPNGMLAAFTRYTATSSVLSVRRTDATGTTMSSTASAEDSYAPAWSPDNKRLAYSAYNPNTDAQRICLANVATAIAGAGCVPNSGNYSLPSWLDAGTLVVEDDSSFTAPLRKLTLAGVATGIAGTNGGYQPSVSPDHTQVAFLTDGANGDLIKVVNLTSGAVRTLPAPDMVYSTPSWTRDGKLVYVSGWTPSGSHIVKVSTTGGFTYNIVTSGADEYSVAVSTPDVAAPTGLKLGGIPATTLGSSITPTFSASDVLNGIASYTLSYRKAASNTGYGGATVRTLTRPTAIALAKGYTYCFSVRATDRAGNTTAATAEQCTVVPLDDRSLTRSSGFAAVSGSGYYAATGARATSLNQTMTRTGGTTFKQLFVVASTCPTCGTVDVLVGGARVARISLASGYTVNKKVFATPTFTTRSGTVVLKVVTSGRPVLIDGLGYRK